MSGAGDKAMIVGVFITPRNLRHEILLWRNYGVVMPSYATTNGSVDRTALLLASWLRSGPKYRIESDVLTGYTADELRKQLSDAYWKFMFEAPP